MQFKDFSQYLEKLEKTPSRNEMTKILAELFKKCSLNEIDKACYLCLGRLAPKYESIEFNMAEKMMIKALTLTAKRRVDEVQKLYKKMGDLGELALNIKNQKPACRQARSKIKDTNQKSKISINEIYNRLREIAEDSGEGSVERKINKVAKLLEELDSLSAKYVARIPVNKLRLGFSDMTILDALSWMEAGNKSLRPELEKAFNVLTDIGKISKTFKIRGIRGVRRIRSEVGVPIRAALAERLKEPEKILEKMKGKCALEPKYDGFRCQLHIDKSRKFELKEEMNLSLFRGKRKCFTRLFSRNLENTTYMFPDIVEAAQKLKVKSAILDGEAIAYNPKTGKFLPFQETVQRKRKHGVGEKAKEMPLKVFVFDLLYFNGKSLLNQPFVKRRKLLEQILLKSKGEEKGLLPTRQKMVKEAKEFNQFFNEVVGEELEGLMAKKLDAVYQAGARNFNWVKYKAGMKSELADTIDCIVMGYYRGKGKRSKFGIGAFLVGIILPLKEKFRIKNDELRIKIKNLELKKEYIFLTVSKIGTGLTDEQWQRMFKSLRGLRVQDRPKEYLVDKNLYPDVWCKPELVVEIEADTITKSPIHTAGLALRFPRLKRFRDEKKVEQTTGLKELEKLKK
jgi:DNA ligase-1